jgi:hypothetical protein
VDRYCSAVMKTGRRFVSVCRRLIFMHAVTLPPVRWSLIMSANAQGRASMSMYQLSNQ